MCHLTSIRNSVTSLRALSITAPRLERFTKRTVASAETVYVDPSALLKLYLKEPESRAMTAWRSKIGDPLIVTRHGRLELTNGIGLALYRGIVTEETHEAALAALEDDFTRGAANRRTCFGGLPSTGPAI
jgi:hypothetical protein